MVRFGFFSKKIFAGSVQFFVENIFWWFGSVFSEKILLLRFGSVFSRKKFLVVPVGSFNRPTSIFLKCGRFFLVGSNLLFSSRVTGKSYQQTLFWRFKTTKLRFASSRRIFDITPNYRFDLKVSVFGGSSVPISSKLGQKNR